MKGQEYIAALIACSVAPAALAQNAPPDLSGQYDGGIRTTGSLGLCRVGDTNTDCTEVPYTEQGEAAARAFDRAAYQEVYASTCTVAHMPDVTSPGRYLLRIHQDEELVHIVYQRTDTIRTVRMSARPPPADFPHTRLGFSTGHWEEDALIVETSRLVSGSVGNTGNPYSEQARVTERYWKEPGDEALNMEVVLEDPVIYTRPFVLSRNRFESRPEWEWTPWNCSIL